MKMDSLKLDQLLRYGFCGFFFFISFIYGVNGFKLSDKELGLIKDHQVWLITACFAMGVLIYTVYRALLYPCLGQISALCLVCSSNAKPSGEDRKPLSHAANDMQDISRWGWPVTYVILCWLSLVVISLVPDFLKDTLTESYIHPYTSIALSALVTALVIVVTMALKKEQVKNDHARWQSILNQSGAQFLEEWASQIHFLYTSSLALGLGSIIGACWPFDGNHLKSQLQINHYVCYAVALLFMSGFISDCRRRYTEKYLNENKLVIKSSKPVDPTKFGIRKKCRLIDP